MGVLATLRSDSRFEVTAEGVWPYANAVQPTVTLTDLDVVVADYDTALAITADAEDPRAVPRIMVVTQRDRESEIRQAIQQGVLGYVLIGCSLEEIVEGVLAVHRGQRHLSRLASQRVAETYMNQSLTGREQDVLRFLVVGCSNKMIASELEIAVGTVKSHVKAILDKLGANTRTEAAAVAARRGLVAQEPVQAQRSRRATAVAAQRRPLNDPARPAARS